MYNDKKIEPKEYERSKLQKKTKNNEFYHFVPK